MKEIFDTMWNASASEILLPIVITFFVMGALGFIVSLRMIKKFKKERKEFDEKFNSGLGNIFNTRKK